VADVDEFADLLATETASDTSDDACLLVVTFK